MKAITLLLVVLMAALAAAQQQSESLGDLAKQARERQKNQPGGKIVFTNDGIVAQQSAGEIGGQAAANTARVRVAEWSLQANRRAAPNFEYAGSCPVRLDFSWGVVATEATTVAYRVVRSDGPRSTAPILLELPEVNKAGLIHEDWTLGANIPMFNSFSGWYEVDIESPNWVSQKIPFTLHCTAQEAAGAKPGYNPHVAREPLGHYAAEAAATASGPAAASPLAKAEVSVGALGETIILTKLGHPTWITFSPDFRMFATTGPKQPIRLWDLASGQEIRAMSKGGETFGELHFSADGKLLASVRSAEAPMIWDVSTGAMLREMEGKEGGKVALSADSRILAAEDGFGTVRLYDTSTGKQVNSISTHQMWVQSLAFSPDGRRLVAGQGRTDYSHSDRQHLAVWDVATGQLIRTFPDEINTVGPIAFSPDGSTMATGQYTKSVVKLWDFATGAEVRTLSAERNWSRPVLAFSPDGKRLAAGWGDGGRVEVWDIHSGEELFGGEQLSRALTHNGLGVPAVAFSPDGSQFAIGYLDGSIRVWGIPKVMEAVQQEKVTEKARAAELADQQAVLESLGHFSPHATGLKDCGGDFACFMKAFDDAQPAMVRHVRTGMLLGMKITETAYVEVSGFTPERCTYYMRVEDRNVEFTDESRKWMEPEPNDERLEAMKKEATANSKPTEFEQTVCIFPTAALKQLLANWSRNEFNDKDFGKALRCKGDIVSGPMDASHMEKGMIAERKGDLAEAGKQYRLELESNPNSETTRSYLAELYLKQKQLDLALAEYRKMAEIFPNDHVAWFGIGSVYEEKGDWAKGAENYAKAIKCNPYWERAYIALCDLYLNNGQLQTGITFCEDSLNKFRQETSNGIEFLWNDVAWFYATSKDPSYRNPSKALEYAQKAVSISQGKTPEILDTLAEAYYVNGHYDKAIETETKALALSPGNEAIKKSLDRFQRAKKGKP